MFPLLYCFPRWSAPTLTLLFAVSNHKIGPHLGFAGCALTARPTLEIFSLLPLNFHATNDDAYDALARHLSALKRALATLDVHSHAFTPVVSNRRPASRRIDSNTSHQIHSTTSLPSFVPPIFPHPAAFTYLVGDSQGLFEYEEEFKGRSLLFTAKMKNGNENICIKFVRRYGKDVHMWCAAEGFAPRLIAFEALAGGWWMVVMELLDKSWICLAETKDRREGLKENMHSVITKLHGANMVHGDLRDTNVMVKKDGGLAFMLVDYDWAGNLRDTRYPRHVNKAPELGRPQEVDDGMLILPQHDDFMLEKMFL